MSDVRLWTFANYRIRDILDVDLVSTTYRATTVDGDELRRVRVFTGDGADGEFADIRDDMIAEALTAGRVTHPHILSTHDAGLHEDRAYVVSDDIHGSVLREFITRNQPLPPRTALAMGWQLAEALDAVHAAGVVHGSINPHTIWVSDEPGGGEPTTYLTGFGSSLMLARQVKNQQRAPASDDLLYVGPDQMRQERVSPEADRYALACAVYHLMTSVPPFRRDSVNALFGAHLFSAVEPPTAVRGDLSPALDSVFALALAKESADRYPSAHALMIGVERALRGQAETRGVRSGAADRAAEVSQRDRRSSRGTWTVGAVDDAITPQPSPPSPAEDAGTGRTTNGDAPTAPPPDDVNGDAAAASVPDDGTGPEGGTALGGGAASVAGADHEAAGSTGSSPEGPVAETDAATVDAATTDHTTADAVHSASDKGLAPPVAGEDAGSDGSATRERAPRRSVDQPADLFEWSGEGPGTVEARRADRIRRNGDVTPPATRSREATPLLPLPDSATAPAGRRRSFIETRNGVLLLVAGALLVAVVGTLAIAMFGDGAERAAPPVEDAPPGEEPVGPGDPGPTVIQPLWSTPMGDRAVRDIVMAGDAVLVNSGRALGALDPSSGSPLWSAGTDSRIRDLVVVRDVAVAVTPDGLIGYDVGTGDVLWRSDDGATVPEAVAPGRREIFTATRDATGIDISSVDPRDGAVEPLGTMFSNADPTAGGLALVFDTSAEGKGGQVLYALTRAGLYAFDPRAGVEIWRAPVSTDGQFDEPELRERPWVRSLEAIAGAAFVVGRDGRICRYAGASGEEVWTTCQQFPSELRAAPALYARNARVIVASPDAIAAFDYTNGLPQWSRTLADELQPSMQGSPDLTYVVREDGVLRALDHDSGLERWRAQDVGGVTALLADGDGVYVGGEGGDVVRLAQQALGGSGDR